MKNLASAAPIFMNPTCAQQHYVQTISYTKLHPNQTIHVESRHKNLIMPSLKCLTAHIFKKVTITEHCFVGNFLYQICFQIGKKSTKCQKIFIYACKYSITKPNCSNALHRNHLHRISLNGHALCG
jgi:hypothetical protein